MLRFWVQQIAAIEVAILALMAILLGLTIVTWIAIGRTKRAGR
jgi:hypothetical protein